MQIDVDAHKALVGTLGKDARARVFFQSERSRDEARDVLQPLLQEMVAAAEVRDVAVASRGVKRGKARRMAEDAEEDG